MGEVIGQSLGNAVGVAISPVPVIALILMLFSTAAARNSLAFTAGWIGGLLAVGGLTLAIGFDASDGDDPVAAGVVKLVVGALFLGLAVRQWRSRPSGDTTAQMPGWMAALDDLPIGRAFGLGLLLTVANPKNLGLTVAAAAGIGAGELDAGEELVALVVFVVLASATIVGPVAAFLLARDRATPVLEQLKDWLTQNNATVMTVLFAVLGAKVLGDGLTILL